jgi:hypothetical protein
LLEGNEIEFKGNDDSTDAGQIALAAAADAGDTGLFVLTFPSGMSISFNALVETFDTIDDRKIVSFSCKVKVTSKPTRGTTAVQLSALVLSAGTLLPSFNAGVYTYVVAATNATTGLTVTPTSAGASITVNDVDTTSGSPSGTIALTSGAVTEIDIIVQKSGYVPTCYKIYVERSAT